MTETVQKGDFVEIDYTGIIKDGNIIFDTTNEATAKKEGLFDDKMTYGPVSLCIGQGQLLQGLDESIEGLQIGAEQEVTLPPEKAFGRKDGKLMKLVPTSVFKKQGINPMPGLQIQIDGAMGIVRTASGGRCVVDFNSPLAGKEIIYKVNVIRKLTDDADKVKALLVLALNQKKEALDVKVEAGKATVKVQKDVPEELLALLKERVVKLVDGVKDVLFETPSTPKDDSKKGADKEGASQKETIDKGDSGKTEGSEKAEPKHEGQQTLQ